MFSKGHGKSHGGKPKKEANTKKHHIRNWMYSRKRKKHEANLFAVIMSSGDTPPPAQASISSSGFDTVDDARLEKKDAEKNAAIPLTSMKAAKSADAVVVDPEAIEEAALIVRDINHTQQVSSEAKMENGIDVDDKDGGANKESRGESMDECLIDCLYYTQECCLCTIL